MDFDSTAAAITTHVTAAAAALTNPIVDVAYAHPIPTGRCVRIHYVGEVAPALREYAAASR